MSRFGTYLTGRFETHMASPNHPQFLWNFVCGYSICVLKNWCKNIWNVLFSGLYNLTNTFFAYNSLVKYCRSRKCEGKVEQHPERIDFRVFKLVYSVGFRYHCIGNKSNYPMKHILTGNVQLLLRTLENAKAAKPRRREWWLTQIG